MTQPPPRSTRTDTLVPDPTPFRSCRFAGCKHAPVPQRPADRQIIAAVLSAIADPHDLPVRQFQPARTLNLKEEELYGIGRPGDFQSFALQRDILDRGPVEIGNKRLAIRSEERREGKECVSTFRSRGSRSH